MFLLLKEKWEYRGIGLVEVLLKVCSVVVNSCLKRSSVLYDALLGFREGMEEGTTMLEANLEQHLYRLTHDPLFQVFMHVCKDYDSLDM